VSKTNDAEVEELRWKKFPLFNDGFVALVDVMGDDADIVQAARTSYKGLKRNGDTTTNDSDEKLLRYLMRHRHTTPFEMAELKFMIRVPMDCWRQWIRHRMASVNEYSTRYAEAIDARQETEPTEWRLQATANKQGSAGILTAWPDGWTVEPDSDSDDEKTPLWFVTGPPQSNDIADGKLYTVPRDPGADTLTPGEFLTLLEKEHHDKSTDTYLTRLALGVAKEQARKDLPLSTYTEAYWKIDLHNLLHFLGLRMDAHAQKEIRDAATIIGEQIVARLFPKTWQAFLDYRVNAVTLSALDVQFIRELISDATGNRNDETLHMTGNTGTLQQLAAAFEGMLPFAWEGQERCPERDESFRKLAKLGILHIE